MSELLDHLLAEELEGVRIIVQLHGEPLTEFVGALTSAGASVVTVPVYRWTAPEDVKPLHRLVETVAARRVDAVVFTSAPAVTSLLQCAADLGLDEQLLTALRTDVLAACVGPVCAAPLDRLDVPSVHPERGRLGSLVRTICDELPVRSGLLSTGGRTLQLRGRGVVLAGEFIDVPPVPLAVLRALVSQPERVLSRRELLDAMPGSGDNEHVIEMAVGRLRKLTGQPQLVRTVVQRGYQVRLD
jgi:uroporphyrinogen-III synthase